MSRHADKPKLTGVWRSIHAAVWLIGLAILAWKGWWWPGILVLIAISGVFEAILMQVVPQAVENPAQPAPDEAPTMPPPSPKLVISEHRLDALPTTCPNCGGPIRGHEVRWTGPQSADCPYCGVNLPMKNS